MALVLLYKKEDVTQQQHNNSMMSIRSLRYIEGKIQVISAVVSPVSDLTVASPLFSMVNCGHNMQVTTVSLSSWIYSRQYIEKSLPNEPHLKKKINK